MIETIIKNLLSNFKNLLTSNVDQDLLEKSLEEVEQKINKLEDDEDKQKLFEFYKYELAKICIDSGQFHDKKVKFQKHLKQFQKIHQELCQTNQTQNIEEYDEINKKVDEKLYQEKKKNYHLVLGNTGEGKSSFINKIAKGQTVPTSNQKQSHTQTCQIYEEYIDTPGINDTQRSRYEILLMIVKFLKDKKIKIEDLFIILIQNNQLRSLLLLREFSYAYFIYELFGDNISHADVKILTDEFLHSCNYLNYSEDGLHEKIDNLTTIRKKIFQNKNKVSNYFQQIYAYHIKVQTFFDKKHQQILQEYDEDKLQFLKEQIWSEQNQEEKCYAYNKYLMNQQNHLLKKIKIIQKLEIYNDLINQSQEFQNILLIGTSQVGKSSLIEQLTKLKGLRGSGIQSETSVCSMFRVDYKNQAYRFIDTPGYNGTEPNQSIFSSFKIIADYLKRNKICEFKILLIINKDTEVRDTSLNVLNELFLFISYIFDQDSSFIDNTYLDQLLLGQPSEQRNKILLKDKILKIFIPSSNDLDVGEQFLQYTFFKINFITSQGTKVQVEEQEDNTQKEQLFQKINYSDFITIEDKIIFRLKRILLKNLISSIDDFSKKFNELVKYYLELSKIKKKLTRPNVGQNEILSQVQQIHNQPHDLITQKKQIEKQLNSTYYNIIGDIYKQSNQILIQLNCEETIKNQALKHFLPIQYTSILFEVSQEQPTSMLISRKQHYYSLLTHQLSKFVVDFENIAHKKKLEDLAEIKLLQELSYHNIEHSKIIEDHYQQNAEENINLLHMLSLKLNKIFSNGIQAYQQFTYITIALQQLMYFSLHSIFQNIFLFPILSMYSSINALFIPIRIGLDFMNMKKGLIGNEQFKFNSHINLISIGVLFALFPFSAPVASIFASATCIFGYLTSNKIFTSKYTFDLVVGKFFKEIITDYNDNQQLRHYEQVQLLRENFNFTNYKQLQKGTGYDMFRKLEKDNFVQNKKVLTQLFKTQENEDLKNQITKYIVENFILQKIIPVSKLEQQQNEKPIIYLQRIIQQLKDCQLLIKEFYNRHYDTINSHLNKTIDLFEKQLKTQENQLQNQTSEQSILNFSDQEQIIKQNFKMKFDILLQLIIIDTPMTYTNYNRLSANFNILFNTYCNLVQLKAEKKLKQQVISNIQKDREGMKFVIQNNSQNQQNSTLFQDQNTEEIQNLLNYLIYVDKYIESRYLQQAKGNNSPNFTSLDKQEIIENEIEFQIDLHGIAEECQDKSEFLVEVRYQLEKQISNLHKVNEEQTPQIQEEQQKNIRKQISDLFQGTQFLNRLGKFHESIEQLRKYFV